MLNRFHQLPSITLKFIVLLAPAVTITTAVFCAIVGFLTFKEQSTALVQKLELVVQTHGGAIADPLWNVDIESAQSSVATIVLHPEIVCALVSETQWSDDIEWPIDCTNSAEQYLSISAPLITNDHNVGKLEIYYTKNHIFSTIIEDMLESALLFVLLILVSAIVAYAALRLIVHTPLDLLLSSIRASEGSDSKSSVVNWSSDDELGSVVNAYNAMRIQVELNTAELVSAREGAEKADASKTRFLANMSHELRTPLNAVIGITEMMRDQAIKKEENIEPYERVTRAGRHLLSLIDNILDFSKIEADRIELSLEEIPTQTFLHDIRSTALELARRNDNEFILECGQLPAVVRIDVLRLSQILINLIGNATKFTKQGSVVLSVNTLEIQENTAPLDFDATESLLEFRISDSGIGMSQDQVDRLFGEFTEIDQAVTRRFGGTGLGLAISQRLCQLMGSAINVTSEPGKGSEFYFQVHV